MPFRALTGYEDAVRETARLTEARVELTEDEQARLTRKLQRLADKIASRPLVTLTYFQPDKKKAGGAYVTATGRLRKFDDVEGALVFVSGERMLIEDILEIQESVRSPQIENDGM